MALIPAATGATGTASFSLTPTSGSYAKGDNLTITVYETSTDTVNAVGAYMTYDPTKLEYTSVDVSQSDFSLNIPYANGSGNVQIASASSQGYTGTKLVGTVTFKVLAGSGTTSINFDGKLSNYGTGSAINRQSDTVNVWNGVTTGGTYTLTGDPVNSGSTTTTTTTTKNTTTTTKPTTTTPSTTTPSTTTPTTTTTTTTAETNWVSIKVADGAGKPISGAVVVIGTVSATTDDTGVASFPTVTAGEHTVSITYKQKTKTEKINVANGKPLDVQQFKFTLAATGLAAVHWADYALILLLLVTVIGSGFGLSRVLAAHGHHIEPPAAPITNQAPAVPPAAPTAAANPAAPPVESASSQLFYPAPGTTPRPLPEEDSDA